MSDRKRKNEDDVDNVITTSEIKRVKISPISNDSRNIIHLLQSLCSHDKVAEMLDLEELKKLTVVNKNILELLKNVISDNYIYRTYRSTSINSIYRPKNVKLIADQTEHYKETAPLPPYVKYLDINGARVKGKSLKDICPNLTTVVALPYIESIEMAYPIFLSSICFGWKFNQRVDSLPESVLHILFGHYFNRSVRKLPSNLLSVGFNHEFNQPIDNLPTSTVKIYFSPRSMFQQDIKVLPEKLEVLILPDLFARSTPDLPNTLTHFRRLNAMRSFKFKIPASVTHLCTCSAMLYQEKTQFENVSHLWIVGRFGDKLHYPVNLKKILIIPTTHAYGYLPIPENVKPIYYRNDKNQMGLFEESGRVLRRHTDRVPYMMHEYCGLPFSMYAIYDIC